MGYSGTLLRSVSEIEDRPRFSELLRRVVGKTRECPMTANEFRKVALALPDAVEQSHMNHPDFGVGGKIFATLGRDEAWGMVKLTPEQQPEFMHDYPKMFEAFNGAWEPEAQQESF